MKVGILANVLCDTPLPAALDFFRSSGIEMVEIGCGGTPGVEHCDPDILLRDSAAFDVFKRTVSASGLEISAFSCHGNPVHPNKKIAERYDAILRNGVLMAEKMGVDTLCTFSGTPGDCESAEYPDWVTSVWPFDGVAILDYQWNKVLIPYWREFGAFAAKHSVTKIAIEMHPGFCVSNAGTLLRLREACGEFIGANFDPSHMIWHGVDCPTAIRALRGAVYHFHAKDVYIDPLEMGRNGFFDPSAQIEGEARPFQFKIPPYGSGEHNWRLMVSALRDAGYDGALSIEHEDPQFSQREGIVRAADFLNTILYREDADRCNWKASIREYQRGFLPQNGGEAR